MFNQDAVNKAIDAGRTVYVGNERYKMVRDTLGRVLVKDVHTDYAVGVRPSDYHKCFIV